MRCKLIENLRIGISGLNIDILQSRSKFVFLNLYVGSFFNIYSFCKENVEISDAC